MLSQWHQEIPIHTVFPCGNASVDAFVRTSFLGGDTMRRLSSFRALLVAGALYALSVGANPALSQEAVITGKVTAEGGRPIGGASVFFPDFHIGANTAPDGSYTIRLPADRVKGQTVQLAARYIGYTPVQHAVTLTAGTQEQSFLSTRDVVQLNEVVVTGTGGATETKKIPFAVGVVSADQLKEVPSVSAL